MDNAREKLLKLVAICPCESSCEGLPGSCPDRKGSFCNNFNKLPYCAFGKMVDHLIANGVTVQEWIPVTDPPKEWRRDNGEMINYFVYVPEYGVDIGNYAEPAKCWLCMGLPCKPTHWAHLPTPPKGE